MLKPQVRKAEPKLPTPSYSSSKLSKCPVCEKLVAAKTMNRHLDEHLASNIKSSSKKFHIQHTLASDGTLEKSEMPRFFCAHLPNASSKEDMEAKFLFDVPDGFNLLEEFKWPEFTGKLSNCYLLCNKLPNEEYSVESFSNMWSVLMNTNLPDDAPADHDMLIPFLKSHIQKAIRRCKRNVSVLTAWHMIRVPLKFSGGRVSDRLEGLLSQLRRLSIIIIEDVRMHQEYPALMWLFVFFSKLQSKLLHNAQTGVNFKSFGLDQFRYMMLYIMGWADALAKCPLRDDHTSITCNFEFDLFTHFAPVENLIPITKTITNDYAKTLFPKINDIKDVHMQSLLLALLLRVSYGGHDGDKEMILRSVVIWYNRFQLPLETQESFPVKLETFPVLLNENEYSHVLSKIDKRCIWPQINECNVILEAADFHTFPAMADKLFDYLDEEDQMNSSIAFIKEMIWFCSSAVNYREYIVSMPEILKQIQPETAQYETIWSKYKGCNIDLCKKYIKSIF
jgi:hypothetical protein